jgi:hypothetical protein
MSVWPQFSFYEKDVINSTEQYAKESITSFAPGKDLLCLGDSDGNITILDEDGQMIRRRKCFSRSILGLCLLQRQDHLSWGKQLIVVTGLDMVSKKNSSRGPINTGGATNISSVNNCGGSSSGKTETCYVIKLYEVAELSSPLLTVPVDSAMLTGDYSKVHGTDSTVMGYSSYGTSKRPTLTAFSVLPDGSQIAMGFSSGLVIAWSGPDLTATDPSTLFLQPLVLARSHAEGAAVADLWYADSQDASDFSQVAESYRPREERKLFSKGRKVYLYVIYDTDNSTAKTSNKNDSDSSTKLAAETRPGPSLSNQHGPLCVAWGIGAFETGYACSALGWNNPSSAFQGGTGADLLPLSCAVLDPDGAVKGASTVCRSTLELSIIRGRDAVIFTPSRLRARVTTPFPLEKCVSLGKHALLVVGDDELDRYDAEELTPSNLIYYLFRVLSLSRSLSIYINVYIYRERERMSLCYPSQ